MATRRFLFHDKVYLVVCDEGGVSHPSWFSFEDEHGVRMRDWLIQPGDCVFDVGAAYGSYTLTALAAGAAHVFAWSPQGPPDGRPEHELLDLSLKANGWRERCDIYVAGVYNRKGWLHTVTQEFTETPPPPNGDIIEVSPLDEWYASNFLHRFPVNDFRRYWLKLDVEGAEVEVFQSAERLLADLRPAVLLENHNFKRGGVEKEVRDFLTARGYTEISTQPYHAVSHSLYLLDDPVWREEGQPHVVPREIVHAS